MVNVEYLNIFYFLFYYALFIGVTSTKFGNEWAGGRLNEFASIRPDVGKGGESQTRNQLHSLTSVKPFFCFTLANCVTNKYMFVFLCAAVGGSIVTYGGNEIRKKKAIVRIHEQAFCKAHCIDLTRFIVFRNIIIHCITIVEYIYVHNPRNSWYRPALSSWARTRASPCEAGNYCALTQWSGELRN